LQKVLQRKGKPGGASWYAKRTVKKCVARRQTAVIGCSWGRGKKTKTGKGKDDGSGSNKVAAPN